MFLRAVHTHLLLEMVAVVHQLTHGVHQAEGMAAALHLQAIMPTEAVEEQVDTRMRQMAEQCSLAVRYMVVCMV